PDVWGDPEVFEGVARSTYNNLLTAGAENDRRLLNFSRMQGWDPNFLVYDDRTEGWQYGGRLLNGEGRPYLNYAGSTDGSKIHVVATEQHPRDFDNSIYHGVTDGKALYDSAGRILDDDLSDQDAAKPVGLTMVFQGDPDNVAWMADVAVDRSDQPVVAFSVQKDGREKPTASGGLDHRYHIAWVAADGWRHREIAFAGERLYPGEDDYTGLVALDPQDVGYVVISTNADPATGAPLISRADGRRHYELFGGTWSDGDGPIAWQALTRNSTVDNIRPVIPAWDSDRRVVLWMRGTYTTYTDFDTDIVGIVQSRADWGPRND
ncbi:MAG: BNR-4 repeat-containing protein, partial [Rhodothermales bacterium]|nr:BNR-4 repeat-containing protein [Rhodothermales bacterium]